MPKGFLGVFRITGPKKTELDVFDPEGRYLYVGQSARKICERMNSVFRFRLRA